MDANFFYYSVYDRFIQIQPCVCMCAFVNFFFKRTSPQKLLTGLLPNFIVVFLRQRLKSSLHRNRKIRPVERYRRSSTSSFSIFCLCHVRLLYQVRMMSNWACIFFTILQSSVHKNICSSWYRVIPQCFLLVQNKTLSPQIRKT